MFQRIHFHLDLLSDSGDQDVKKCYDRTAKVIDQEQIMQVFRQLLRSPGIWMDAYGNVDITHPQLRHDDPQVVVVGLRASPTVGRSTTVATGVCAPTPSFSYHRPSHPMSSHPPYAEGQLKPAMRGQPQLAQIILWPAAATALLLRQGLAPGIVVYLLSWLFALGATIVISLLHVCDWCPVVESEPLVLDHCRVCI